MAGGEDAKPRGALTQRNPDEAIELATLALASLLVGVLSGAISAAFRFLLLKADALRDAFVLLARDRGVAGFLAMMLLCLAAATFAAWLVRRFSPIASGSGIPHVESVLQGELPPAPARLIPVKFIGGVLAIGSGLALGREGPSVQMCATIGNLVQEAFHLDGKYGRVLLAAGAGAGLAAAFDAPVAGAVFVLEELVRAFELHIAIAALGASATAISVSQAFLGSAPEFNVGKLAPIRDEAMALFFVFGLIAGLVG
ncbi:MAG TPA: chloride channel protein, partial [Methylocystis sp.]|nr:chloride channel protein [Methylocystis sp.]